MTSTVPDQELDPALEAEASTAARSVRPRFTSNVLVSIAMLFDLISVVIAAPIAMGIYELLSNQYVERNLHVTGAIVVGINFLLIRLSRDSYSAPLGQGQDAGLSVGIDFLLAVLLAVATLWQLGMLVDFSRGLILLHAMVGTVLLLAGRFALRQTVIQLVRGGVIGQRIVVYGAEPAICERVVRLLELERLPHLCIAGIADERATRISTEKIGIPFIGGVDAIAERARRGEVDQVLIAAPHISQARLDQILDALSNVAVDVCLVPRESLELTATFRVQYIGSVPMLYLWSRPLRDLNGVIKMIEDKVVAAVGLIVLAPLLLVTALLIKATSRGPIFFVQKRFGFNNVEIDVIKFRSMVVEGQDHSGSARTRRGDRRVTPIGRVMRRLSIDELPQLWNVLRGDMAIVGPRPHATMMMVGDRYYFDAVRGYAARHRVKPGITGLAQVRGLRGEIDTIERARKRVDYDLYYIDNWSLMLDLRIIVETVVKLAFDRQAY